MLDDADLDLGSVLPAIVPAPSGSTVANIGVQGGKEGHLYVLNLDNLSGQGGPGHTGGELQNLAVPNGGVHPPGPGGVDEPRRRRDVDLRLHAGHTSGFTLGLDAAHTPKLTFRWQNASPLSSPFVANNVLYGVGGGAIAAFNPTTGSAAWIATTGGSDPLAEPGGRVGSGDR